jgi:calcium-dependent protein kinase
MEQACGSVHYVAPEVLAHAYTLRADCWSLGVIVYMLLTGSPPFHGSDDEVLRKIKAGKPHWSTRFGRLSSNAQDFVKKLLVLEPNDRLSVEAALQHPFVTERHQVTEPVLLETEVLKSLRKFAHASHFKRAIYSMMAWSLTTEQRGELRKLFLAIDKDHKGKISHHQVKEVLMDNFHITSEEAERLFRSMDTDHDDEIAYSEFLAAVMQDRLIFHEDVLKKTFMRLDPDNSGKISAGDLKSVLGDGSFEGKDVEELIEEADTDHDGQVSYEEFVAYFNQIEESPGSPEAEKVRSRMRKHTASLHDLLDKLIDKEHNEKTPGSDGSPGVTSPIGKTPIMRPKGRSKSMDVSKSAFGMGSDSPSAYPATFSAS